MVKANDTPVETKSDEKVATVESKQTNKKYFLPQTEQVVEATSAKAAGKKAKVEDEE